MTKNHFDEIETNFVALKRPYIFWTISKKNGPCVGSGLGRPLLLFSVYVHKKAEASVVISKWILDYIIIHILL